MTLTRRTKIGLVAALAIGAAAATAVAGDGHDDAVSSDLGDAIVAQAQTSGPRPHPLTGVGENMELVANIPIDFGSDIELAGDYAYVGTYGTCSGSTPTREPGQPGQPPPPPPPSQCNPGSGGITVINIANPRQPFVAGQFDCAGGQNDPSLSPDGKWMVMAIETRNNHCHPGEEGTVVLSLADPAQPEEVAFLPIKDPNADPTKPAVWRGSHNNTIDWPYLYIDQYVSSYNRIDIFDLSNPRNPERLNGLQYSAPAPGFGTTSPHDLIVDHRSDGKDYIYASSGNQTSDVIDVTDPRNPQIVQRLVDPAVTFAHQSEPNHDGSLTLITDEYRGGGEARACGKTPIADTPRDVPDTRPSNDRNNLGALFLYKTKPDGTLESDANGAPVVAGTYNLPMQAGNVDPNLGEGAQGCTIHIYWQAPDENRLVTSWYGKGIRVADFSNPARVRELGWFIPANANTWSAKPHRGYIFTGDIERGFDVLRYTGEDGKRWPATAGPAEVQRAQIQGADPPAGADTTVAAPTTNANPGPSRLASGSSRPGFRKKLRRARAAGGFQFRRAIRLRDSSSAPVQVTIRGRKGGIVSKMSFRTRPGQRKLKMRAQIRGVAGAYRWEARRSGRTAARGTFRLGKTAALAQEQIDAGRKLVCVVVR